MNVKKTLIAVAIAGFIFANCLFIFTNHKQTASEPTTETATTPATKTLAASGKIETASFNIEGMSCEVMCASKIQKELTSTDGVQKATIDFEKKSATVEYDAGKTTPEKLVEIVEAVNGGDSYKVSNVKSSADHAMLFQEKEKKKSRKQRKADEKAAAEATKTTKPGCCSSKKSCSSSEGKTEVKKENTL